MGDVAVLNGNGPRITCDSIGSSLTRLQIEVGSL